MFVNPAFIRGHEDIGIERKGQRPTYAKTQSADQKNLIRDFVHENFSFTAYGDWTKDETNHKAVWSGTPSSTVTLGGSDLTSFDPLKSIVFTFGTGSGTGGGDTKYTVALVQTGGNAVMTGTLVSKSISIEPTEVTLTGSSVTIADAQDNTVYVCGDVTDVTVTARAANAAFTLIFDSPAGSTPTVLTMPSTNVIMPADFSVEVYTHYEINVDKRGFAVSAHWSYD